MLLVRTPPNFEGWLVGLSVFVCNCLRDIGPGNICPSFGIYQLILGQFWPILDTHFFSGPNFFFYPNWIHIHLNSNFYSPKKFWDQHFLDLNCFWTQNFIGQKFFWTNNIFGPKTFLDQKFFWTKILFEQIFLDPHFFGIRIILNPNFFWT